MPQSLQRFYGGGDLHFLTFSCYRRQPFFDNAGHRDLFLEILERVRRRYRLVSFRICSHARTCSFAGERTTAGDAIDCHPGIEAGFRP